MRQHDSPHARLALQLGGGALLLIVAAGVFGAIAEDVVTGDRLTALDAEFAQWLHRRAEPAVTRWVLLATNLHSTVAVSCYAALAAAYCLYKRAWRTLALLGACVAGGLALNVLMKLAFHRARPVLDEPLLTLASYSFPSGHVVGSTILYGLAVAWVFGRTRHLGLRMAAIALALLAIVGVAFTRMYLGVHYLSDVVAAFAEGIAWLAICLSGFAAFWRQTGGPPMRPAPGPVAAPLA